eukprot:COSAG01_NODE_28149_length_668_cov_0.488576_1_plen_76_part_01
MTNKFVIGIGNLPLLALESSHAHVAVSHSRDPRDWLLRRPLRPPRRSLYTLTCSTRKYSPMPECLWREAESMVLHC